MQITKVNGSDYFEYTNVNKCNMLNTNDIFTFLEDKVQLTKVNFLFYAILNY